MAVKEAGGTGGQEEQPGGDDVGYRAGDNGFGRGLEGVERELPNEGGDCEGEDVERLVRPKGFARRSKDAIQPKTQYNIARIGVDGHGQGKEEQADGRGGNDGAAGLDAGFIEDERIRAAGAKKTGCSRAGECRRM